MQAPLMRLRRSELATPGSSDAKIEKASRSDADVVFLDLEDAVAPGEKVASRHRVGRALKELDWGSKTRAVRINGPHTEYCYADILEVVEAAGDALDILIIPKVREPRDVWFVDTLLTQLETRLRRSSPIELEVLIEEVEGLINVESIARSSQRIGALVFGPGDFAASQGVANDAVGGVSEVYPGDVWLYARNKIVIAARAAGVDAIDGPFADFSDHDAFRRESLRSRTLGFVGKWAIHPNQIRIANEVYGPSETEQAEARALVAAYEDAVNRGLGAVAFNGRVVDAASARIMRVLIDKADMISARQRASVPK